MKKLLIAALFLATPAYADKAITLNPQEENVLLTLIDTANKAGGLNNAENALYFLNKIRSAPQAEKPAEKPEPKPEK